MLEVDRPGVLPLNSRCPDALPPRSAVTSPSQAYCKGMFHHCSSVWCGTGDGFLAGASQPRWSTASLSRHWDEETAQEHLLLALLECPSLVPSSHMM